jgi:hypothetical protein
MVTRRRPRAAAHDNLPARTSLATQLTRAATSPAAKVLYVTVGAAGLAALGIAIFGPRRFQQQVIKPVSRAVGDKADQLWADSRGLREQLGSLIDRAGSESGREKLVRSFQSWIGHFKAT